MAEAKDWSLSLALALQDYPPPAEYLIKALQGEITPTRRGQSEATFAILVGALTEAGVHPDIAWARSVKTMEAGQIQLGWDGQNLDIQVVQK